MNVFITGASGLIGSVVVEKFRASGLPVDQARGRMGMLVDASILDQRVSADKARKELGWKPHHASVLEHMKGTT